eukprot:TRINITY_DN16831_c0_g1_i1.p1 TRINITY_DN16831_c0_g1~~TRINITY_DN16831_c0_g1_i1.p1  ORF type:complete len:258 (+),score=57.76 TRINITY_DN16831_c0_g1_i1:47-775(+)
MTCRVEGKIKAFSQNTGEELRRWGGKECFLTHESDLGPVLVAKAPSAAIGKGTYYALSSIKSVLGMTDQGKGRFTTPPGVKEGKLTIFVDRMKQSVSLQISCEGEGNIKNLYEMSQLLGKGLFGSIKWTRLQLDIDAGRKRKKGGEFNAALKIQRELRRQALAEQLIDEPNEEEEEEELEGDNHEIKRPKTRERRHHVLCDKNLKIIEGADAPNGNATSSIARRRKAAALNDWLNNNYHTGG